MRRPEGDVHDARGAGAEHGRAAIGDREPRGRGARRQQDVAGAGVGQLHVELAPMRDLDDAEVERSGIGDDAGRPGHRGAVQGDVERAAAAGHVEPGRAAAGAPRREPERHAAALARGQRRAAAGRGRRIDREAVAAGDRGSESAGRDVAGVDDEHRDARAGADRRVVKAPCGDRIDAIVGRKHRGAGGPIVGIVGDEVAFRRGSAGAGESCERDASRDQTGRDAHAR